MPGVSLGRRARSARKVLRMEDRLKLEFACGTHHLEVRRFTLRESMSTPFRLDIFARSPEQDIPLEPFLNQWARFTLKSGVMHVAGKERRIHGYVTHIEQLR